MVVPSWLFLFRDVYILSVIIVADRTIAVVPPSLALKARRERIGLRPRN